MVAGVQLSLPFASVEPRPRSELARMADEHEALAQATPDAARKAWHLDLARRAREAEHQFRLPDPAAVGSQPAARNKVMWAMAVATERMALGSDDEAERLYRLQCAAQGRHEAVTGIRLPLVE